MCVERDRDRQERERERDKEKNKAKVVKRQHLGNLGEGDMGILCPALITFLKLCKIKKLKENH